MTGKNNVEILDRAETGSVWLAPTQGVYEKLADPDGVRRLAQPPGTLGTETDL